MSNLQTREVLDSAAIDRAVSHDLYAYNAAVRADLAADPHVVGTLDFQPGLTEFTD